ncbi:RHS repeat-associated core domain-containing protein [Mucilaginibacter sp. HMF5004]|uniref:DUF6443 domain-containing protein n=1 Tax=Mucilaginibacter rivuli TaxID=2857527 RepID=UPI001C5DBF58|nr:DUF6443 domain-containing protein [Mucilaginibacter rivuli]MBW4890149.1 RHS repeat-associated core domain-containing protein [Mucilaginibacter rivuli]
MKKENTTLLVPVKRDACSFWRKLKAILLIASFFAGTGRLHAQANITLNSANTTGNYTATHSITLDNGFSANGSVGSFSATIIPPSLFNCGALGIPSSTMNYVATYVPRTAISDASTIGSHTICEVNQTIQYFDGLGRPIQAVQVKANPDGTKDLIQPVAYDAFGREPIKYLPYTTAAGTSGNYRADALTGTLGYSNSAQYNFYNPSTAQNYGTNTSPYAVTVFESSPLNRPLEQGSPGDVWQPAGSRTATAGRTVVMEYGTNVAGEVLLWVVNSAGATATTSYAANTLYKTTVKDENWTSGQLHTTEEFKDIDGHVVLKRIYNDNNGTPETLSTYYIYDDLNNLSYVVPPLVTATTFTESEAVFNNLIYGYHYDERNRLVQKKIPGKGWEYMVYNKLDQVVATQDANQMANNQWIVTKYDTFGRRVISGILSTTDNQNILQTAVNAATTLWEGRPAGSDYTNVAWPTAMISKLSVSYYDNYDIPGLPYDHHTENSQMTRGLLTASKINVLGTTDMLWTVNYYDDKGRVTSTYAQHYLGGTANTGNYDKIVNTYDFTNAVTASTRNHYTATAGSSPAVTIANTFVYDHVGQKRQSFENINSTANATLISQVDLNETGQAYQKHLHSTDNGSNFLQDITYSYNERGWLKTANAPLFAMELKYNDGTTPQYNGNIANQNWGTPGSLTNSFTYSYDALNRLSSGIGNTGNIESGIDYDKMGNISHLNRYYDSTLIDQLTYNYTNSSNLTNQLQSVADVSSDAGTKGYKTGTHSYTYDANGNMLTDDSKGLTVAYNLLNLPQTDTLSSGIITYTYDAGGRKLRKASTIGSGTSTDYIAGIQYTNGNIDFIQTEEGRALKSGSNYNYEYNLSDHLGNTRLSFDTHSNVTSTTQQTDYMPFGMEITAGSVVSPKNLYLYNAKELQEELGQYDYGARFYDPVIARWTSVDPLAEKFRRWSPYNYGVDNPLRYIDPDGMGVNDFVAIKSANGDVNYKWDANVHNDADAERLHGKGATDATPGGVNKVYNDENGNSITLNGQSGHWTYTALLDPSHYLAPQFTPAGLGMGINLPGLNMAEGVGIVTANLATGLLGAVESGTAAIAQGIIRESGGVAETATAETMEAGTHSVYQGLDAAGDVRYVGITSRDAAIRFGEHLASGTERANLEYRVVEGATGLTKDAARVIEQNMINSNGLGNLLNKINSIAPKNWAQFGVTPP